MPIFDYTTRFKQPAQQEIYEPGPYRASDHDPVLLGLSLTSGDAEEPTDPEPNDPEDPEITEPELTIESEPIAVQNFVANPNSGKDVGVMLRVDGLDSNQEVTFEVTRQGRNGSAEHTATANGECVAEWRVTRDNSISNGPPLGTYDVQAIYGENDEVLNDSFDVVPSLKHQGNGPKNR